MYNGTGLQTPRGSGTTNYVQTSKFFIRPNTSNAVVDRSKDQGTSDVIKNPSTDILEHDRKRQIELKLVILEDKLIDQGYTDSEIVEKVNEARATLDAADV